MSEFYFDYQVTLLSDGLSVFGSQENYPRLFVERNYRKEGVGYTMYISFPQWDARGKSKAAESESFDEVEIQYDGRGIDTVIFDREDAKRIEIPSEKISRDAYRREGFRHDLKINQTDFSGVGRATFSRKDGTRATSVLFFAVNFTFKTRIRYEVRGGKIYIYGSNVREGLALRVNASSDRYPCLESDRRSSSGETVVPNFSQKSPWVWQIPMEMRKDKQKIFLSFDPSEEDAEKFYLLECVENDTVHPTAREFKRPEQRYFCPYCHKPMKVDKPFMAAYEAGGGRTCHGGYILRRNGESAISVAIKDRAGRNARHLLYCEQDFSENGKLMAEYDVASNWIFSRALPGEFMKHGHFKIIVIGSKRAGKTTFISRMFDITGEGEGVEMTAQMMVNAAQGKGFKITPYTPRDIIVGGEDSRGNEIPWRLSENPWHKSEEKNVRFFSGYSIDIEKGRYPTATDRVREGAEDALRDPLRYPFIFEVNNKDYIYFYDIAGEDAESNAERIGRMMEDAPTGIFYLVDGSLNRGGNKHVALRINQLLKGLKGRHCPIAVILTKFDKLEGEFDSNSHCLRADAYDMMGARYEGSALEKNIDLASEEILSYLVEKGDEPKLYPSANIRYFGMSSFADSRAVMHQDQTEGANAQAEINYLRYASSAKRMELPLIWMLRQFGCII